MFEEPDVPQLREWLVNKLENISDADSEILSDYVMALLRHDQPENVVRQMCLDQLQDFLLDNTAQFVSDVFTALKTKEYLRAANVDSAMDVSTSTPQVPSIPTAPSAFSQSQLRPNAPSFTPSQPSGGYQQWSAPQKFQQRQTPKRRGRCRAYDEQGYCMKGDLCPYEHGTERIIVENKNLPAQSAEFFKTGGQRGGRGGGNGSSRGGRFQRQKRPDHLDFVLGSSLDSNNRSLIVENVPPEHFNEQSLRSVFEPFGPIEDLDIDTDHKLAVITFGDHDSAHRAWNSPAPFFDNRFVKVHWQRSEVETRRRGRGNDRTSRAPRNRSASPQAAPINIEEIKQRQAEKQREYEERMNKKREHDEKVAMIKKQSEELLKKQEMEREALLAKIRSASASVEPDSSEAAMGAQTEESNQTAMLKAKLEQLKREAESLGVDTSAPESYGSWRGGRGGYRGRGAPRGRGRGRGTFVMTRERASLDLRPKKVVIAAMDNQVLDALITHLITTFGEDYVSIESHPSINGAKIAAFRTRPAAEQFFYSNPESAGLGAEVKYSWYVNPTSTATQVPAAMLGADDDLMVDDDDEQWRRGIGREENGNGIAMHEDEDGDIY
ncbi:uncharacterized protein V2V93DRAFT_383387 [Kockiozyma suomiensis]|uniref:uncharacterized protein n=1 Tax=Kockiozyma suomiensis TaxID=1337062 RepID=UPI0033440812